MTLPDPLKPYRNYIFMFLLNLAIVAGVIYLLRRPEPRALTVTYPPARTPTVAATKAPVFITVQVSGAVLHAGALQLAGDTSLAAALDRAGLTEDADVSKLALAQALQDGDRIVVPGRAANNLAPASAQTPAGQNSPVAASIKLNLNTATLQELEALPGIGPVLAQRILDYRTQQGGFKTIDELKDVKGIGDTLFIKIQERITVQ